VQTTVTIEGDATPQFIDACEEHLALIKEWAAGERTRPWLVSRDEDGRVTSISTTAHPSAASQFPTRTLVGLLRRRGTQTFIEVAEMQNSSGAWIPTSPVVNRDTGAPITIEPGDVLDFSSEPVEIQAPLRVV
jgi:hypothetical protein